VIFLSFLKQIPTKIWGVVCTVVAGLVLLWALFQKGKSQGKAEAKVEHLEEEVLVLTDVVETIQEEAKVVKEIKEEVNALPAPDLSKRADRWVRD
jgi:hypothetical protein